MKLAKPQETKSTIRFRRQVVSACGHRKDWIVDLQFCLQRECEASVTRQDDSGGNRSIASLFEPLSSQMAKEITCSGLTRPCAMPQVQSSRHGHGRDYAGRRRTGYWDANGSAQALAAAPLAQATWAAITPMARGTGFSRISSAKQPETRRGRIEKACDMLASGKRRLCCFPGLNWLMEKNAKSCGMWLRLPNSQKPFFGSVIDR